MNSKKTIHPETVITILVIFHMIGIAGFIYPPTHKIFSLLTPIVLLICAVILAWFHKPGFNKKTAIIFGVIFLISYLIEVAGVKTALIFGNYSYGSGLGPKIMDTPLLIGLNWLILVYCTKIISDKIFNHKISRILFASLLMVGYDLFLERSAHIMQMWYWHAEKIPVKNYLAWFIIALLLHSFVKLSKIHFSNKMATPVFIIQSAFFVVLFFYSSIQVK